MFQFENKNSKKVKLLDRLGSHHISRVTCWTWNETRSDGKLTVIIANCIAYNGLCTRVTQNIMS